MPRRGFTPWTYRLLGHPYHDWRKSQDERVREAADEARAKRLLNYEHLGFPLRTKENE